MIQTILAVVGGIVLCFYAAIMITAFYVAISENLQHRRNLRELKRLETIADIKEWYK